VYHKPAVSRRTESGTGPRFDLVTETLVRLRDIALPVQRNKPSPRPRLVHAETSLSLDERAALRLAIVADTHSQPHPKAAERIAALAPNAILHAGDIGDLQVLEELAKIAPVVAVRGNIDERASHVPEAMTVDIRAAGASAFKLLLVHIAVYGPKIRADAARLAAETGARLVVCGHSHVPFVGRDRGLTVFNPGSIGPRRMHLPIVFGVLQIESGKLSLRHIDCETGANWTP
jgi:putative phosphoesterase